MSLRAVRRASGSAARFAVIRAIACSTRAFSSIFSVTLTLQRHRGRFTDLGI
jgi:hypothetical protein